jgi:hypothetical protein
VRAVVRLAGIVYFRATFMNMSLQHYACGDRARWVQGRISERAVVTLMKLYLVCSKKENYMLKTVFFPYATPKAKLLPSAM